MIKSSNHRLLLPETIWLEAEDYSRANTISNNLDNTVASEKKCWQTYLDLLALFALETWLTERLPKQAILSKIDSNQQTYYLQVGDFTITAIAAVNILDEMIQISPEQLQTKVTHFYVVLEVNEEIEEAIFRGLLRRDILDDYLATHHNLQLSNGDYSLPLSWFDSEPNHLLSYCQHLAADAIALPTSNTANSSLQETVTATYTKLSQWLQDTAIEGWSAMETLLNPEMNLALSTRSVAQEYKKGKLINLEAKLNSVTMGLLVTVKEEDDDKLGVKIQLYPTSKERYLPPQVQLTLYSKAGKMLQSVQAREKDSYIQLRSFKGKPGKRFSIEIALADLRVREYFEL